MQSGSLIGLRGFLVDAPEFGVLRSWQDGAVIFGGGKIREVGHYEELRRAARDEEVRWLNSEHRAIFPGLIDLHAHLPQYPAVARGESDLLPWLRQYIFPLERDFTGPKSQSEPALFFEELARHGTTTAMLYSAIYEDSTDASFEAAKKCGTRAIIGKTMMDVGSYGAHQPKKVVSISLLESERLCERWHGANDGLIEYAFSPRFAVSCSEKLMRGAAECAKKYGAYLQTHLAENLQEIEKVRNLFMWAESYADVYEKYGLLGAKTVLGHCIHLSPKEIATLAGTGAKVAHCPTSNFFLGSGLMKLDVLRQAGIGIGLGSDVAGGPELNLWQVMRSAVETQKARSYYESDVATFGPKEAFHLATMGGAEVLGKGELIGTLDQGKDADFVVMDISTMLPYGRKSRTGLDLSAEDLIALCVYRGGPHAVLDTYVRGETTYQAPSRSLFG